jgi:hypothetical protein
VSICVFCVFCGSISLLAVGLQLCLRILPAPGGCNHDAIGCRPRAIQHGPSEWEGNGTAKHAKHAKGVGASQAGEDVSDE